MWFLESTGYLIKALRTKKVRISAEGDYASFGWLHLWAFVIFYIVDINCFCDVIIAQKYILAVGSGGGGEPILFLLI